VRHGDDYRSLVAEDDLFTVTLERALALLAEPKKSGRRQQAKRVIRQIEATDGGAALQVLEGRYGPYVTDGETNASIPRGTDPATISLADARGLIEARQNAAPGGGRRRRGAPARKRRPARAAAASPDASARPAKAGRTRTTAKPARGKRAAKAGNKAGDKAGHKAGNKASNKIVH